jgi:hypothetical protein
VLTGYILGTIDLRVYVPQLIEARADTFDYIERFYNTGRGRQILAMNAIHADK